MRYTLSGRNETMKIKMFDFCCLPNEIEQSMMRQTSTTFIECAKMPTFNFGNSHLIEYECMRERKNTKKSSRMTKSFSLFKKFPLQNFVGVVVGI